MREVNFSIPNVNKASVGITHALYDRRALDCTSTLPLINSLNHLAYLTTSSARIRDILTVDGGVERLVCILKQGRAQEVMEMWKWNLAFQCLFNIGVRGSESVRTRVVEADMVPVIATLLDNYIKVIDRLKEKSEAGSDRRHAGRNGSSARASSSSNICRRTAGFSTPAEPSTSAASSNIALPTSSPSSSASAAAAAATPSTTTPVTAHRRQPPPPSIAIPPPSPSRMRSRTHDHADPSQRPSSPRSATVPSRQIRHQHARSEGMASPVRSAGLPTISTQLLGDSAPDLGLRPVRDVDRLPSMDGAAANGITSQPESPTTPMAPVMHNATANTNGARERRRPVLRQQLSTTTDPEDGDADQSPSEMEQEHTSQEGEPMVDIQAADTIDGTAQADALLDTVTQQMDLTAAAGSETSEAEPFTMPHAPGQDGSIIATNIRPPANAMGNTLAPNASPLSTTVAPPSTAATHGRYTLPPDTHPYIQAAMPRDEDVLMSLQLLAYVSKYCNLRLYFQASHMVPKLMLGSKLELLDPNVANQDEIEAVIQKEVEEEEYLLQDNVNIFPLVEKFTVRHHSNDIQYWAGVVMRNLCRKDDSRGGIRQCAYYKCGKWEQYPRQFAKCRRCRRTKYCSKECQKNAWVYHRHWCMLADGR